MWNDATRDPDGSVFKAQPSLHQCLRVLLLGEGAEPGRGRFVDSPDGMTNVKRKPRPKDSCVVIRLGRACWRGGDRHHRVSANEKRQTVSIIGVVKDEGHKSSMPPQGTHSH